MAKPNMTPELIEALSRVRATMPKAEIDVADRMMEISGKHLFTYRDRAFESRFRKMKRSLVAHFTGDTKQHRILIVTGESHSGKTAMIENALNNDPSFEPYADSDGNMTIPVLRLEAPSPAYLVNLALEGLNALGYPMDPRTLEKVAWSEFRKRLKQRKVLVVLIDEAQHTVNSTNRVELQKLRDILKHMVQMKDWPIRLILAGVSPLEKFREDRQIRTRSMTLHLGPVTAGSHLVHVRHWVAKVVTEHAELKLVDFMGGDFPERLIHCCGGCFGSIVQLTRMAVEEVLLERKDTVDVTSFAAAYATLTGCPKTANIFEVRNWRAIDGAVAKIDGAAIDETQSEGDEDDHQAPVVRLKPLRGGERPK